MIDDEFIKKTVKEYKATRSIIALKEINDHLSNYIYNYPRKVFGVYHEDALEFYSYYIERIENSWTLGVPCSLSYLYIIEYTPHNYLIRFPMHISKHM